LIESHIFIGFAANTMKNELIEAKVLGMVENQSRLQLQCQVLNQEMTTFHFPRNLDYYDQPYIIDLWQSLLAEKLPKLHTITSSSRNCSSYNKSLPSLLTAFPNLVVLRLENFQCKNTELINIADQPPKLR
jgi:hypothetical protein